MAGKKRAPKEQKPWEQQAGEPDAAYARFLLYRNLGPGRSLDAAYRASGEVPKSAKKRQEADARRPGNWSDDSALWNWKARAEAWDVHVLLDAGRRVVTRFIAALDRLSERVLSALDDASIRPESWSQVLESFGVLSGHVQPEAVRRVAADGAAGEQQPGGEHGNA